VAMRVMGVSGKGPEGLACDILQRRTLAPAFDLDQRSISNAY